MRCLLSMLEPAGVGGPVEIAGEVVVDFGRRDVMFRLGRIGKDVSKGGLSAIIGINPMVTTKLSSRNLAPAQ
jgi:hypothetical protein